MKNKWIECSKKLPKKNEKVIFYPVDDESIHGVFCKDTGFSVYLGAASTLMEFLITW